uniref:Predicted DNA binding protein, CopG/RHH family n=1 Tax=Candidatus Kentrum sp. TUN TaxID=2126343 RepID=A0A451AP96_9GAMM|nr:MAG: Predicted DNA binding protein, CopG/RHH family [Candidatus Kentron sp. TUN]VFK63510.1 MAG: Predicted DNA binding protein, CopG/RHH family [Candidatus Kentron sp. TUN]VFK67860.1 MAG: Predicted DNA binding protein, CopG/RHH family [Candidatus Kentron sp. TUN]
MSSKEKLKNFPRFETDREAEDFVDTADLSEYDFSGFTPLSRFEFQPKDTSINLRLPRSQLDAVKAEAAKQGLPYQRFIRELLQRGMETLRLSEIRALS